MMRRTSRRRNVSTRYGGSAWPHGRSVADQNLFPDQRDVLLAFLGGGVRFLIVGGWAFSAHAYIRTTKDLDLWVDPSPENAKRVWQALADFGAPLTTHNLSEQDFQSPTLVYQLGQPPARIDILPGLADLSFDQAWGGRVEADLDGIRVPIIGLNDLITAKTGANRKRDRQDISALNRVKKRRGL